LKLKNKTKIIAVTGAESTGKSTLTQQLAAYYKVPFLPETAREYVEKLHRKYTYSDVEIIARQQIENYRRLRKDSDFIIIDTWLIITKIWFEFVFGKKPDWLEPELLKNQIDLFLLCDIDLPWIEDPVRENGGENRELLHKKYIENLEHYGFNYKIVGGTEKDRLMNAIHFINESL
jgi:NadR type nicotinamide-nucleotide adenylyltransferase